MYHFAMGHFILLNNHVDSGMGLVLKDREIQRKCQASATSLVCCRNMYCQPCQPPFTPFICLHTNINRAQKKGQS